MPSIIPGYEYDIFISYRQNDNQDGWVMEFVDSLNREIKATFKEDISIYFDENPHDGLLETHDVDQSLNEKIKCLVFIPIVSQTYCDPTSFAWQQEFIAFRNFVKEDEFGLDIKLADGNVAKRILPVRIHELENDDQQLFEKEIYGVMRSMDFIYSEPGVNRPLALGDSKEENLNRTRYKDQINKTANAIKNIIYGLQKRPIPVTMVIAESNQKKSPEKSIAVLPFANMSNDPEQEYFCDGLAEDLLNLLSQVKGLKVAARTSAFSFKDKNVNISEIGNQLKVRTVLEGSVRKAGDRLRITAQLINCKDGYHLWSERYDRNLEDIFAIQDEIAFAITAKLKITLLEKDRAIITKRPTQNTNAYEKYLMGRFYLNKRLMFQSIELFKQAVSIAPDFALAYAGLADALVMSAGYSLLPSKEVMPQAKQFAEDALKIDSLLCEPCCSLGLYYTSIEWNWAKAKDYFLKSIELNPSYIQSYLWYGHYYLSWVEGRFEEAKRYIQVAMELDPLSAIGYVQLAAILVTEGKFEEALKVIKIGFELDPNSYAVQRVMGLVHIHLKQYKRAIKYLEFASEISKRSSFALVDIVFFYTASGTSLDKATKLVEELNDRIKDGVYVSPWHMGVAEGHLGNLDDAINWFEAAYHDHDAALFCSNYYPWFPIRIRQDLRFKSLISKLKLP